MDEASLIGEVPARAARLWGRRAALFFRRRIYSFVDVERRVSALAADLCRVGVTDGQRVAVFMENRPEYFFAYFAVPASGSILVPINTFLAPVEARGILADAGATALVASDASLRRLGSLLGGLKELRHVLLAGKAGRGAAALPDSLALHAIDPDPAASRRASSLDPVPAADPSRTAVIIYTSGTTGTPKGVMLSHRNLLANAAASVQAVGASPRDRLLLCLPMFHSFTEMVGILAPMVAGMSIVLCKKLDRAEVRKGITRRRPTIFPGVPAVFTAMAHARLGRLARFLNPIRLYISGGAPLSLDTLRAFEALYQRPLCEGYGLSEASPVVALNPPRGQRKPGSVGLPLPGVELRIVSESGEEVSPGQTGHLLVRGDSVMQGYFGRPDETRAAIADGWLRTGDLARRDEDGYLFIMGRSKEMLIYRGMNVYPREIEQVLEEIPSVREAAVIGLQDASRGEVPYAFIVPMPGSSPTESEIKRACLERLARYKVPRVIRIVRELPRNPAGKVMKEALREEAALHPSG